MAGEINKRKEVKTMVEPTRRLVEHAHFAKRVLMKKGEENRVGFDRNKAKPLPELRLPPAYRLLARWFDGMP